MVEFNGYTAMKSSALYPASGDSDDYMYKMDIGVGVKDTMFVHTPEVGTAFWQPSSEIIATCKEMLFPNLILAHITRNYVVVKDTDPMNISTLSGNFYLGVSAGSKTIRAVLFYEYGFTNILNKLNKDDALKLLNNGDKFKGNLGCINGQVIINL